MAFADVSGRRLYYRLEGRPGRPVIALCHVLGLDHTMWDPQVPDLVERFHVLRYDLAGTVHRTLPRAITASPTSDRTRWRFWMSSASTA